MTKKNILPNLIFVCVLVSLFITVIFTTIRKKSGADFSFDDRSVYEWNDGWDISYENTKLENQSIPVNLPVEPGKTVVLKKTLPKTIKKYNCVLVTGDRQDISVSIAGVLRESYSDKDSRIHGKTSPSIYLVVPIYGSDAGTVITIRMTSDSIHSGHINGVSLGNEMSIVLTLIKTNVVWIVSAVILLILSIIAFIGFRAYRQAYEYGNSYIYVWLYSGMSAIWYFSSLTIKQLIIKDLAGFEIVGYCCYMLSMLVALLYNYSISNVKHKKLFVAAEAVAFANFIEQMCLFTLDYYDFDEMSNITSFINMLIFTGMLVLTIHDSRKNNVPVSKWGIIGYTTIAVWCVAVIISYIVRGGYLSTKLFSFAAIIYTLSNIAFIQTRIGKEQKQRKDAESASKAKSLFLANMSHEIRTPINAVLGMNELIIRDTKEENIRGYSVNIADAGKSLLALVNDILDFSKIESGKMDIIPTEYKTKVLLNDLILMTKSRMSGKELKLETEIDEEIPSICYGDEVRIKQVVTNILTNAVKYTKQGSVTLKVAIEEKKGNFVTLRFAVKDTGKGIKKEDLSVILNSSFNRVNDEENRAIEGTGLGLSITRQLLELMNSKLEVESEFGKGSTFAFSIKQKIIDPTKMGSVYDKEKRTVNRKNTFIAPDARILVVDDVKMNIMVLCGLLKPYGIKPVTCDSGEKCLEICKDNEFDVILLDHMMPGIDGIETFKRLKSENLIPDNTTVIVLTANAVSGASKIYLESGFDAYMTKPVDVNELDTTLKKYLGNLVKPLPDDE